MKIIVRQLSGLGNQMFQYAAGLYYAGQHDAQVQLIIDSPRNSHAHGDPRPFLLPHFCITAQYREINGLDRLLLSDRRHSGSKLVPLLRRFLGVQIVRERLDQRFQFQSMLPVNGRPPKVYLAGYWQVQNIAESISDELRREFTFRAPPSGRNLEMLRVIRNADNPVSVHIRRGDYTLKSEGNVAMSMEYYERAIARLQSTLGNPTFFIFSDDINFAKKYFKEFSAVFIDHNDAISAHEDLRLMSSCRHHIIANSTFSWWGAWLNPLADKVVLAPRNWLVAKCPVINDLMPKGWRLVD